MLTFYITFLLSRFERTVRSSTVGQRITVLLLLVVLGLVSFTVYMAVAYGLVRVSDDEFLQIALPAFLYETFLLVVLILVAVSALISTLTTFFAYRPDNLVMVGPQYRSLLLLKFLQIGTLSLWPLVVLAVPVVMAMHTAYAIGLMGILIALSAIVFLAVTTVLVVLSLVLMLGWLCAVWLPKLQQRMVVLAGGCVAVLTAVGWYIYEPIAQLSLVDLFQAQNLDIVTAPASLVTDAFMHTPSHVAALVLVNLQVLDFAGASLYVLLLFLLMLLFGLVYTLQAWVLLPIWQYYQEGSHQARARGVQSMSSTFTLRFGTQARTALFVKDLLIVLRSPRDVFWLGFLIVLWLIVTSFDVMIHQLLLRRLGDDILVGGLVYALQLLVISYFTAAIVLRFVLPSFSMERDTAWSLLTAPVSLVKVFAVKAAFSIGSVTLLTTAMLVVHLLLFNVGGQTSFWFIFFAITQAITITWLGYCMGVWFPNFSSNDPQLIATSLPGLAFTALALSYGAVVSGLLYLLSTGLVIESLIAMLIISFSLAVLIGRPARANLDRIEFVAQVTS